MPCYFPLQAFFTLGENGKKQIKFSNANARLFHAGEKLPGENNLSIPCGRCMGCRLERSRQWAVRCCHEAKLYKDNCFVTLTYAPEFLPEGGTLVKKHVQDFIKRLRRRYCDRKIRVFYCGEYGENLFRPHYHLILFNCAFVDKVREFKSGGFWHFSSKELSLLWPYGRTSLTGFSFETAAYVARYCTKKINGVDAEEHYAGRLPEFSGMSLKPGIGAVWLEKYGASDVFPHDNVVSRGVPGKVPRYYDVLWERMRLKSF